MRWSSMRIAYFAIRSISFKHNPLNWYLFECIQILLSFEAASIDSNIQIQLNNLFYFFNCSSEWMNNSRWKSISIFTNQIVKIITSVSVVQVHGQLELLSQIKVIRKHLQLMLLAGIVQSVVIQTALSDSHQSILYPYCFMLHMSKILF